MRLLTLFQLQPVFCVYCVCVLFVVSVTSVIDVFVIKAGKCVLLQHGDTKPNAVPVAVDVRSSTFMRWSCKSSETTFNSNSIQVFCCSAVHSANFFFNSPNIVQEGVLKCLRLILAQPNQKAVVERMMKFICKFVAQLIHPTIRCPNSLI